MTLRRLVLFSLALMMVITFAVDSCALLFTPPAEISSDVASSAGASLDLLCEKLNQELGSESYNDAEESAPNIKTMPLPQSSPGLHTGPGYENFSDSAQKNYDTSLFDVPAQDTLSHIESLAETLLAYDPEDYLTAYNTSKAAYDIADYEKAMKWIKKALSISPRYAPALSLQRKITKAMKNR